MPALAEAWIPATSAGMTFISNQLVGLVVGFAEAGERGRLGALVELGDVACDLGVLALEKRCAA